MQIAAVIVVAGCIAWLVSRGAGTMPYQAIGCFLQAERLQMSCG